MVLAGVAQFRSGRARQIPAVCHRHIEGAAAGLRSSGGHERHAKVPDPSGRSVNGAPAVGAYLVSVTVILIGGVAICYHHHRSSSTQLQPTRSAGLQNLRQAALQPSEGNPRVLRGLWICLSVHTAMIHQHTHTYTSLDQQKMAADAFPFRAQHDLFTRNFLHIQKH